MTPITSASPCGQFVFEGDEAGIPHCWRLSEDGLGLHRGLVWSRPTASMMFTPLFAPDGGRFATCTWVPAVAPRSWTIHRTADGELLAKLDWPQFAGNWLEFTPDGGKLLACTRSDIFEWDTRSGGASRVAARHPAGRHFFGVAVHPGGRILAGLTRHAVSMFDLASGDLLRTYDWKFGSLRCVAFTPDGTRCVVAGSNGRVLIFDVE